VDVLYTVVFSLVLRVPVQAGFASFPEFLLPALLPWMAVQEGISRSASSLVDNAAMVKKTVFPVETLVLSVVIAAVVNELVALAVFAVYVGALGHLRADWLLLLSRPAAADDADVRHRLHRGDVDRVPARHRARGRSRTDGRLLCDARRVSAVARAGRGCGRSSRRTR
jgi:hypothetical protein